MTPKNVWVSIYQQILHEFRTAIRRAKLEGVLRQDIERNLLTLISESTKDLVKMTAGLLLVAVSAENLRQGGTIPIKTSFIEVSIPAIYFAFMGSIFWFGLIMSCLAQTQYLSAKVVVQYVFHKWRRFSEVEWALSGSTYVDVTSPFRNGHLLKIRWQFLSFLHLAYFLSFIILSIPIFGSVWSVLHIATNELRSSSNVYLGSSLALATVALVVLPVIYSICYFVPFPIKKDFEVIRWNFLVISVWGSRRLHPQSKRWQRK